MIGVYALINICNNKMYVGGSKVIETRIGHHMYLMSKSKHYNQPIQSDYYRYGYDAFSATILEVCSIEELKDREQWWLDNIQDKYNLFSNARGGSSLGKENKMKGKTFSEEARANMSAGSMGQRGPWRDKPMPKHILDNLQEGRRRYNERRVLDPKLATVEAE